MSRIRLLFLFLCVVTGVCSVFAFADDVNFETEKAALLKIHQEDRRAHFERDIDSIVSGQAESFITVSSGEIQTVKREDTRKFFTSYFQDAKYFEWDDLEPPIIRISKDGSMAWMITRLKVRRTQAIPDQEAKEQSFTYAGIMTFEKQNGEWVRIANVSTFQ